MNNLYTERLKRFRKSRNGRTTQYELSEDLDISTKYYSQIENNDYTPSVQLHLKICLELNKPSDCFFRENRTDLILTDEQFKFLNSLSDEQLDRVLNIFQIIAESKIRN